MVGYKESLFEKLFIQYKRLKGVEKHFPFAACERLQYVCCVSVPSQYSVQTVYLNQVLLSQL